MFWARRIALLFVAGAVIGACANGRDGGDANGDLDGQVDAQRDTGLESSVERDSNVPKDSSTAEPDAARPDASTPDASTPDAKTSDASLPDANTPDASLPDASLPDASQPDASVPDAMVVNPVTPGSLVINEIEVNCPGDDFEEFVEVLNRTGQAVDLTGVALVHVNGSGNNDELDRWSLSTAKRGNSSAVTSLASGEILVLAQQGSQVLANLPNATPRVVHTTPLQNGPDVLYLVDGQGTVIDSVVYQSDVAGFGEGAATQGDLGDDRGLSRCPAGVDTNNNANDFVRAALTPAGSNTCP